MRTRTSAGGAQRNDNDQTRSETMKPASRRPADPRTGRGLGKAGTKRMGRRLKRCVQSQEPPVRRKGPLPKVKQTLATGGYDVPKTRWPINVDFIRPKRNAVLILKKTETTQVRTSSVKSPCSKDDLRERKLTQSSKGDEKSQRQLRKTPKAAAKPTGETPKAAAKLRGKTPKAAAKPTGETPKAAAKLRGKTPKAAAKPTGETPKAAAKLRGKTPKAAAKLRGKTPKAAAKPTGETSNAAEKSYNLRWRKTP